MWGAPACGYIEAMKILLTNAGFAYPGGTQSWVQTMHGVLATEHEVHVHSHRAGELPPEYVPFDPGATYDLALVNHGPCMVDLRHTRIRTRIMTSHGVVPAEEWARPGADAYAAVSEYVAGHIPWRSTIIRNPIDVDRFRPRTPPAPVVRKGVFLSNRQGRALGTIREACALADIELEVVGGDTARPDPENAIDDADLVFGIGRSALEGLACGRRVVAFDHLGYSGTVTPENLAVLRRDNFAGYLRGRWPDAQELATELRSLKALSMRDAIVEEHAPEKVADAYLRLAGTVSGRRRVLPALVRRGPRALSSSRVTSAVAEARRGDVLTTLRTLRSAPARPRPVTPLD